MNASPSKMADLEKLWKEWLYQPPGLNWLIRILLGVATYPVAFFVYIWSRGGPGPYNVPAWRWGSHLLELPLPSGIVTDGLFIAVLISALALVCGLRTKIPVLIIVSVISYYASRDWFCMGSHITLMFLLMTASFLFERKGKSPTRRLIQISIGVCYFFSALQKMLYPDFFTGVSMQETFQDGWGLNHLWQPYIRMVSIPSIFWMLLSTAVIGLEFFLAVGLFFKRTRKVALILAYALHLGILVFLDFFIAIFSLVMFAGLLAFVQTKEERQSASPPVGMTDGITSDTTESTVEVEASPVVPKESTNGARIPRFEPLFLAGCVVFGLLMPMRVYFWPGHPINRLAFFDRSPWSFCMFLARQETKKLTVEYETADGKWHSVPSDLGRMGKAGTDNEMYAMMHWLFQQHPEAVKGRIDLAFDINNRSSQLKSLVFENANDPNATVELTYQQSRVSDPDR